MKRLIGFLGIVIAAAVVFLTTKNVNQDQNVNLSGLMQLNTANAECIPMGIPQLDTGQCFQTSQHCYWMDPNYVGDCDPWAMGS